MMQKWHKQTWFVYSISMRWNKKFSDALKILHSFQWQKNKTDKFSPWMCWKGLYLAEASSFVLAGTLNVQKGAS